MILLHILISLLFYTQVSFGYPTNQYKNLPSLNISNPQQINGLLDPISDSYSDVKVDTLITKVQEISNRYRKDVNGTIADVQQILNNDQKLPRLTRGEIIDLLENFTNTNPEELKQKVSKGREEYKKALMLVLPYTPKNSDNFNIEELYTKPPITHIVSTEVSKPTTVTKAHNSNKQIEILAPEPSTSRPLISKRPIKPHKFTKSPENSHEIKEQPIQQESKTRKEVLVKQIPTRQETIYVTTTRKPFTTKKVRFPNHRYPEESEFKPTNQALRIVKPPSLVSRTTAQPELLKFAETQEVTQNYNPPIREIMKTTAEEKPLRHMYKATMSSTMRPKTRITKRTTTTTTTTTSSPLDNIGIPDDIKDAVKGINFGEIKPVKFSSQYDSSAVNFPKKEAVTENIKDILESIGGAKTSTTTTTTQLPDISDVAHNLSPDMKELLISFGIIEDPNKPVGLSTTTITPPIIYPEETEVISPFAYTQFKPLPDSAPSREDMEEFLASFGLTGNSQRSAKSLKHNETTTEQPKVLSEVPAIDIEMIPETMHGVLEDIGLTQKKTKKLLIDQETNENRQESHVFNPEQTYVSENEIQRLSQLLETIKRLEKLNRTATPEDLQDLDLENIRELTKILKQNSASLPLDQQNFGPNPLDFDASPDKNEVKRQESTTSTTPSTITLATTSNPSLTALEESFGGNSATTSTQTTNVDLPPPRRTGFYYLVDWNTFLEVGEEDKKVNIRFTPMAGDPSRFLRVNVP